ncbi:hypothetical protein IF1G_03776 [Cordyceps javanica]|uniref:Uncharacterized protein n=1 Tax=Cordyceps javanica TaxID=43265 RepID=A0A545V8I5_9HYPO|nr:hypothetical protein IF1G_03776 [Cordyceps javanica]
MHTYIHTYIGTHNTFFAYIATAKSPSSSLFHTPVLRCSSSALLEASSSKRAQQRSATNPVPLRQPELQLDTRYEARSGSPGQPT